MTPPEARQLLRAAAERLDGLAGRTTPGEWRTAGLLASRPEVVAHLPDGGTEHVAEARARSAEWIVGLSPALAAPLAAWLRAVADDPTIGPEPLAVARVPTAGGRPATAGHGEHGQAGAPGSPNTLPRAPCVEADLYSV